MKHFRKPSLDFGSHAASSLRILAHDFHGGMMLTGHHRYVIQEDCINFIITPQLDAKVLEANEVCLALFPKVSLEYVK